MVWKKNLKYFCLSCNYCDVKWCNIFCFIPTAWSKCCLAADSAACLRLNQCHFHSAFEKFTPSTLHNVPILKPSELTWSDVGGLHDVRTVLQQTLVWPTKVNQSVNLSVTNSVRQPKHLYMMAYVTSKPEGRMTVEIVSLYFTMHV